MKTDFDDYLLYRALHRKFTRDEPDFDPEEAFLEKQERMFEYAREEAEMEAMEALDPERVHNICFKASAGFLGRLTVVCDRLDLRKRDFMMRAVDDAMTKAEKYLEDD